MVENVSDGGHERCEVTVVDSRQVFAIRAAAMDDAVAERMAALFKVLSDPGRCRIVAALIVGGEVCVCDIAAAVGMSASNVSHHLRVLRDNGLVRARREGKMVFYAPDDAHVRVLLDSTRAHVQHVRGRQ